MTTLTDRSCSPTGTQRAPNRGERPHTSRSRAYDRREACSDEVSCMNRPAPVDMAAHPYLSGLFAPQRDEVDVRNLEVLGDLPADLHGSYLRNGPNPRFDPIGSYLY